MNPGFTAPPAKDFTGFAGQMDQQATHFGELSKWSGKQCHDADDLWGILLQPIQEIVPQVAQPFTDTLTLCGTGMTGMSTKAKETRDDYQKTEHETSSSFAEIYGQPLPGFPDISKAGVPAELGTFADTAVELKEPDPAGDETAKDIEKRLEEITKVPAKAFKGLPGATIPNIGGYILQVGEKLYKLVTGQSLIDQIIMPIVGNYGRLKYLENAYDALGSGTYTVAGTMREGTVRLGGEWEGECATAFDSLMFRWSMGTGGLGDAAKIVAKAYKDGFDDISRLVFAGLEAISQLIDNELRQFVEKTVGEAAIEAGGGGPEDPLADVAAILWEIYKDYKIVLAVIKAVEKIIEIYGKIKAKVEAFIKTVQKLVTLFKQGIDVQAEITKEINKFKHKAFTFEESKDWNPEVGVARIALLPS